MIIAVDTGGTKTLVWVFDQGGAVVSKLRFETPPEPESYITELSHHVTELAQRYPIDAVSVALPCVVDHNVAIESGGNLKWKGLDLPQAFASSLPGVPILVENDANLGGLGETRLLDPTPASSLYVTVSTGIGTGFITNGAINQSLRLGEGGHSVVEFDGVFDTWEHIASGKAIYEAYQKLAQDITDENTWNQIADRISRGFLMLIPLLRPDIIIIGGGVGTHFEKYGRALDRILDERLYDITPRPKIVQAKHPEEAVIYGCYYNAIDHS